MIQSDSLPKEQRNTVLIMNSSSEHKNEKLRVSKTLFLLGVVSFIADISSEMLYPITPIFISTTLGASIAYVGVIEGIAECVSSLLKDFSGAYSDLLKNKRSFILWGYFFSAIAKPIIGISSSWTHVLSARTLDRFGKGIRSAPRDAMIAESAPSHLLGAAFGWHRGIDTLGAFIGAMVS